MLTAIVTTKGQIVIPAKIRRRLNIKKGTRLCVEERDGEVILTALTPNYFEKIAGILKTKGKLTKALLTDRLKDQEKES